MATDNFVVRCYIVCCWIRLSSLLFDDVCFVVWSYIATGRIITIIHLTIFRKCHIIKMEM